MRLRRVRVATERVAELDEPIAMAHRPGDDSLYVAQRGGSVVRLADGGVADEPVLDISGDLRAGGERGLLGIAFSPDGQVLYASFTNRNGDSRLVGYPMRGQTASRQGARRLLAVEQPYGNHNGGHVAVGPDEKLYLGLGDGGSGGDPHGNGQDLSTVLGKLLRLELDGSAPADNPFAGRDGAAAEIYALGLRNPWRFSFDRETDALWIADVGQNSVEEVNVTPRGQAAGANYGWNIFEGSQRFSEGEEPSNVIAPVVEYPTAEGCAVTGGYVYRGAAIPQLRGAYLYSDFCAGWVRAVRVRDGEVADEAQLDISLSSLASFGEDADGELYLLSLDGPVERIVPGS